MSAGIPLLNNFHEEVRSEHDALKLVPKDARAAHCKTTAELELFLFSSNYQTRVGGNQQLADEIGIDVERNSAPDY